MTMSREDWERAVRATCAPKRRTLGEWWDDNCGWFIIFGWAVLVAVLGCLNDLARMLEMAP